MNRITPEIRIMTREQINKVHGDALTILEKTGIKVDDEQARHRFEIALGKRVTDDRIRIPEAIVQWAIEAAPSRIRIFDRLGRTGFSLASDRAGQTVFGVGVTNLHYHDPARNRIEPFTRQDMARAVGLCHTLDQFDFISTPGVIQDLPPQTADLYGILEMLANTTKPMVMLISDWAGFNPALDLCEHLCPELSRKPFLIPYVNPITPLILNAETTLKMESTIQRGLPLIFSNYGMSGATCPITPGGTLALLTAELLAGLVYSQLVREGTPIIMGSLPAAFDMKNAGSYYSSQSLLLNLACARMMKFYGIPHCGTSGCANGWGADLLAATTLVINHVTGCIGGAGMVPFVGGSFDSLVFSPELTVYADDLIRQSREFARGFDIGDDAVGFDDISDLGPGGNFLVSRLTTAHFRDSLFSSTVWPFFTLDKWRESGSPSAASLLNEKTCERLRSPRVPEDRTEILARGEAFLKKRAGR